MTLGAANNGLQWIFRFVAMVALGGLVFFTAVDVIGRVMFNAPLGFAYELIGILLGVAVYGGLISANHKDEQIRIDLFEDRFARYPRFDALRHAFSITLELAFFTLLAAYIIRQGFALMRWKETFLFLDIEKWIPVFGFAALACFAVLSIVMRLFPTTRYTQEDDQ